MSFAAACFIHVVLSRPGRGTQAAAQGANAAALVALSAMVAWSRVYLGYHSPAQVFAGLAAGTSFGLLWGRVTLAAAPLFPRLERSALGEALALRDTSHLEDPLAAERRLARDSR
eukprot:CAMPEP_0177612078 /NCGR_PEP_ID=MMETSP0419_2-20121207/20967_1 /TAXON_ID=582737 /ORGANISM="Tetraselmis sp., Strain GSL018" /LENGTH=114 /DNA_ID=CAMNT_0019108119 /DNA_START=779 /DNA_END=1120 /DNA_ORIENTATION=-